MKKQDLLKATQFDLRCAIALVKKGKAIAAVRSLRSAWVTFDRACNIDNTKQQNAFREQPLAVRMIKNIFST